ncbi:MAG: hypothetical protein WBP40_02335 [Candidatus Moraniibacteriota bacterium]
MAQIKRSTLFFGVAALALLVAAVKFLMPSKGNEATKPITTTSGDTTKTVTSKAPEGSVQSSTELATDAVKAKDVSVKASYKNPSGEDQVGFTLSVDAAGVIVDAKAEVLATNDISKKRQLAFAEGLSAAVKGKKLTELTAIDRVGGSSLTTKAFNDSIDQLKSQM